MWKALGHKIMNKAKEEWQTLFLFRCLKPVKFFCNVTFYHIRNYNEFALEKRESCGKISLKGHQAGNLKRYNFEILRKK